MNNFITYDECELYPGSKMNMIMGPNGTGKSSIVAAIAIGLGWSPLLLGRSKDIVEYIKYGCNQAIIEIVLKSKSIKNGFIRIKRKIEITNKSTKNEDKKYSKTEWTLSEEEEWREGGESKDRNRNDRVNISTINKLMNEFNIQLDNLCQFLPQDRVSEFARLDPIELLRETEKIASDKEILQLHQKLIEKKIQERGFSGANDEAKQLLTDLTLRNEQIEITMKEHHERIRHALIVKACQRKRITLLYKLAQEEVSRLREERNKTKTLYLKAEKINDPLRKRLESQEKVYQRQQIKTVEINSSLDLYHQNIQNEINEINSLTRNQESIRTKVFKMRETREKRNETISFVREEIKELERKNNSFHSFIDFNSPNSSNSSPSLSSIINLLSEEEESIKTQLVPISNVIFELEQEISQFESKNKKIQVEGTNLGDEINYLNSLYSKLENIKEQRMKILETLSPDTHSTLNWLSQNRKHFKDRIYGPIFMEVTIKEPLVKKQIENIFSRSILFSFVVTNLSDLKTLLIKAEDENKWRINVICVDMTEDEGKKRRFNQFNENENQIKNISINENGNGINNLKDEIISPNCKLNKNENDKNNNFQIDPLFKSLGFYRMAIDCIEAPKAVMLALCDSFRLDMIPISINPEIDHDRIVHLALKDRERFEMEREKEREGRERDEKKILNQGIRMGEITEYVTSTTIFRIKYSRYDPRDYCISCKPINENLGILSGEDNNSKELTDEKNRIQGEIKAKRQQLTINQEKIKGHLREIDKIKKEKMVPIQSTRDELITKSREITLKIKTIQNNQTRLEMKQFELKRLTMKEAVEIKDEKVLLEEWKELTIGKMKILQSSLFDLLKSYAQSMITHSSDRLAIERILNEIEDIKREIEKNTQTLYQHQRELERIEALYGDAKERAKRMKPSSDQEDEKEREGEEQRDREGEKTFEKIEIDPESLPNNIDDLDQMILVEQSKAQTKVKNLSPITIQEYEQRKVQISTLEQLLLSKEASLDSLKMEIQSIKSKWLPKVTKMIQRIDKHFSNYFKEMNLDGHVQLVTHEREDFDRWELNILVKFREDQQLQRLSWQRQSGGERSVTTILYLLSLQEITSSPFRIVDEINQGMDAKNERMIHGLIVKSAINSNQNEKNLISNGDQNDYDSGIDNDLDGNSGYNEDGDEIKRSSQYFLITPKLLTGLEYHEKMNISCLFSGAMIPKINQSNVNETKPLIY